MVTEAVVALIEKVERPYQAAVGSWLLVMALVSGLQVSGFDSQWLDLSIGNLPPFWTAHVYAFLLLLVPIGSAVIREAIAHIERSSGRSTELEPTSQETGSEVETTILREE